MTRNPAAAPLADADTTLAATTARLLHAGARSFGSLGLTCAGVAVAALWLHPVPVGTPRALLLAVLLLLPLERVLTLRLHFDSGLFTDLSRPRTGDPLPALDLALGTLRLRAASAAARPLADRAQGACKLLFWQGCCVLLQCGAVAGAVIGRLQGQP